MVEKLAAHAKNQDIPDDRAIRLWPWLLSDGLYKPDASDDWGLELPQPQWIVDQHDRWTGRVFLLGTGPSLIDQWELLPRLQNEFTWTCNRARRANFPFTPSFHSVTEPGPIGNFGRYVHPDYVYPEAGIQIAVNWVPVVYKDWKWASKAPDILQIRWEGFQGLDDHLPPLVSGWASPITLLQLAAWFGFSEFYILGCDLTQVGQAWDVEKGNTKQPRSILSILECADRAAEEIKRAGRKIYDCTPGGRMNQEGVLEFVELADVI